MFNKIFTVGAMVLIIITYNGDKDLLDKFFQIVTISLMAIMSLLSEIADNTNK